MAPDFAPVVLFSGSTGLGAGGRASGHALGGGSTYARGRPVRLRLLSNWRPIANSFLCCDFSCKDRPALPHESPAEQWGNDDAHPKGSRPQHGRFLGFGFGRTVRHAVAGGLSNRGAE